MTREQAERLLSQMRLVLICLGMIVGLMLAGCERTPSVVRGMVYCWGFDPVVVVWNTDHWERAWTGERIAFGRDCHMAVNSISIDDVSTDDHENAQGWNDPFETGCVGGAR